MTNAEILLNEELLGFNNMTRLNGMLESYVLHYEQNGKCVHSEAIGSFSDIRYASEYVLNTKEIKDRCSLFCTDLLRITSTDPQFMGIIIDAEKLYD